MYKVLGFVVLAGGLAFLVGENAPSQSEREQQVAAIARIASRATIVEPETVPAELPGLRRPVGSPATAYVTPPAPGGRADTAIDGNVAPASSPPAAMAPIAAPPTSASAAALPPTAANPTMQRQLALAIQTELKRVGCYTGRLDGSWGERSRTAMATFVARVNASLPMNEPDVFLLSLVKGQRASVCGVDGGTIEARAVPASPKASPSDTEQAPIVMAARQDPLPGRMSIGGPVPGEPAASPPPPVTEWTAPPEERLPWQSEAPNPENTSRMAALEPEDTVSAAEAGIPRPFKKAAKYKKTSAPSARPAKQRYSSNRSVQQLFMHPLGRM